MKLAIYAVALVVVASSALAKIPLLNATCPGGIEVHADEGGPVYINGQEAKLKTYSASAYDATLGNTTVSLGMNPDSSVSVMYTGKGGANGICHVKEDSFDGAPGGGCPADVSQADRNKYRACN